MKNLAAKMLELGYPERLVTDVVKRGAHNPENAERLVGRFITMTIEQLFEGPGSYSSKLKVVAKEYKNMATLMEALALDVDENQNEKMEVVVWN